MILLSTIQYNTIRIVQHNTCTVPVIVHNLYIKWNSLETTGPVIFIRWNWQFCFNIQNCNRIMQISFSNKFLACQPIKRLKVLKNLTTMREWNVASSLLHVLIIQIYTFKNRKKTSRRKPGIWGEYNPIHSENKAEYQKESQKLQKNKIQFTEHNF